MSNFKDIKEYDTIYVDGMNYCSIYYHAVPTMYKGHKTGMLTGVTRLFTKCYRDYRGAKIVFLWEGESSLRKSKYPTYKANRKDWRDDEEFFESLDYLKSEVLEHMGIDQRWCDGLEADDLAAFYAKDQIGYTLLISGDQDWCAYTSPSVDILIKNTLTTYDDLKEKFGFDPNNLPLYKTITGDSSDNVKGLYRFPKIVAVDLAKSVLDYKRCESILREWGKTREADLFRDNQDKLAENEDLVYPFPVKGSDIVEVPGIFNLEALTVALERRGMEAAIEIISSWS